MENYNKLHSNDSLLIELTIKSLPELNTGEFQWQLGLRRTSSAARLLGLRVRIPPGTLISVTCERCVLSARGLRERIITSPEESYRVYVFVYVCVCVCVCMCLCMHVFHRV